MVAATLAARSGDESGPAAVVQDAVSGSEGPTSPFRGATRPPIPPSDFELADEHGRLVRLSEQRGKVVVVAPMYAACGPTCFVTAQQIKGSFDDLRPSERSRVRAFALSVDPGRDTPRAAQRALESWRVRGNLTWLLGTRAQLRAVWRKFGFPPRRATHLYSPHIVVIDALGRQRVGFPLDHLTPEGLRHDLQVLLREES
jgi:protein SCO1/2